MIFISFDKYTTVGGPTTFMNNLRMYISREKYPLSTNSDIAQAIFFPVSYDLKLLRKFKKRKMKIIQRLDGVYYPSKHGSSYKSYNHIIRTIYNKYSDYIVFQSTYSRDQCFAIFGERPPEIFKIIYNGVDKDIFYPDKNTFPGTAGKMLFVTTGNFRNLDMLEPIIKALDSIRSMVNFELAIAGPIPNSNMQSLIKRDYIRYKGSLDLNGIAHLLKSSHIYLYSHLNPPCPNSVIEAISCGLPVVGFDSGAMRELLFFCPELLAYVSDDLFQEYKDFDYNKLAEKILVAVDNYPYYRKIALDNSNLYSFDDCGRSYIEVFDKYLEQADSKIHVQRTSLGLKIIKLVSSPLKIFGGGRLMNAFVKRISPKTIADIILKIIRQKVLSLSPVDSLALLFGIENRLYELTGQESIRYGSGIHTKHRHIKYHNFFVENIEPGSRILDVGCGNGALSFDIANIPGVYVCGIDLSTENILNARKLFPAENIRYIQGNVLEGLPDDIFDVIVLSNVLEHIEKREELLKILIKKYDPRKILLRVPTFERDWRIPLKKEIGIDYRLDSTHYIEYTQDEFTSEMEKSGLKILKMETKWGEIWSTLEPMRKSAF